MTKKAKKHNVEDIELFHLILEAYGWNEQYNRNRIPYEAKAEAIYSFHTKQAILEVKFHQPLNMISLHLENLYRTQGVQFHFMYSEKPELILEWITQEADKLTFENYPTVLKRAAGKCEMILLELGNNKIYEVIPPNN